MNLFKRVAWWVDDIVNPKQRWLTRNIPRHWTDKCVLIPEVLFSSVIHFVRAEDGLSLLSRQIKSPALNGEIDPNRYQEYTKVLSDIRAAYEWAVVRDRLFKNANFEEKLNYKKIDIQHMESIVRHHQHLWT